MSTSSEASPSPSPPQSPVIGHGPLDIPSLARLVVHFVDAKRSLTATRDVYRANDLVTNSRSLIEGIAVLNAKNDYGRRALHEQADTLRAIKEALVDDSHQVADEFEATIAALDKAHARLEKTLNQLKRTIVAEKQTGLQSGHNDSQTEQDHDDSKTLFDFIDEDTHETLMASLRGLIDSYHDARADQSSDLSTLDASIKSVTDKLSENADIAATLQPDKRTIYDDAPPAIPDLFHDMEEHATAMASLLENLVNHYDLCVNALKHTEGGGQAAKAAIQQQADEMKDPTPGSEESLYRKTVAEPISEADRIEMLHVLEKDSVEVEDVLVEIRDRIGEIEDQHTLLNDYAQKARSQHRAFQQTLSLLREIRTALPRHLNGAARFRTEWENINSSMRAKTKELAELGVFYEQFLSGYGRLLKEVDRRKASESAMRRIADKARKELEKLHEVDRLQRAKFWEEVAAYMPRDLGTWHGLDEEAARWEVTPVYSDVEQGNSQPRLLDGS